MDNIEKAQEELASMAPAAPGSEPKSLDDVIAGLRGFGIEEFEEILTLRAQGRDVRLRISNVPTSDEMAAVLACDEFKGYNWVKKVKVELLSRSITWIDGIDLRRLPADKRFVKDPTDGEVRDVQLVLRNSIMGWGHELVEVLWKVLMTHSQGIEDRLKEEFPKSALMTEVEQRLFEEATKQIEDANRAIVQEEVAKLYDPALDGELPEEEPRK